MKNNKAKIVSLFQSLIHYAFIVFMCSIIGAFLLLLAFLIPINNIDENVKVSAEYLATKEMYPHVYEWCTSRLDLSTDSIMLLKASDNTNDTLINKIMNVYSGKINGDMQYNTLINKYINDMEFDEISSYARYWHGYLVILKPLLYFFNYEEIITINGITQVILCLLIIVLFYIKEMKKYIIPYVISLLLIMPICIAKCLQFSSCFYIFNIITLLLLVAYWKNSKKNYLLIFLISGVLTSYFDFFTYPISTLGVPLVVYLIIDSKEKKDVLLDGIKATLIWLFGYATMWFNKWLFASVLTKNNIIMDAINTILFRTQSIKIDEGEKASRISSIIKNINSFFNTPFKYILVLFVIIVVYSIIKNKKEIDMYRAVTFLSISLMPIFWYIVVANHSYIHSYFTNKSLIVTVFSIMSLLIYTNE